jgi:uncharacterized protein YidB (DUF937 family)
MEERTTLVAETALQRLLMERALAMAKELERTGRAATHGQVLDELETAAMAQGRDFTRAALEGALQGQVDELEKKLRSDGAADVANSGVTKGRRRVRSSRPPVM